MNLDQKSLILLLFALAVLTRVFHISYPPRVVFDEAHYGLYATKYLSGEYYFDFHPPLGNMIYGLVAYLAGAEPGFSFERNALYGDFPYLPLRLTSAFFGSLLVPLIFVFARELGLGKKGAFLASFVLLFENSLVLESRLALINIFLVFFIFASLYFYLRSRKKEPEPKSPAFTLLSGLFFGLASSVKMVGLGVLVFIFFHSLLEKESLKKVLLTLLPIAGVGLFIYISVFSLHFLVLKKECLPGKCGYVVEDIRKKMEGGLDLTKKPHTGLFVFNFLKTQAYMLVGNVGFFSFFAYGLPSFFWPLMVRPFPYFFEGAGNGLSYLYLIGNPLSWLLCFLGLVFVLVNLVWKKVFKKEILDLPPFLLDFLVPAYLVFWIPFFFVDRFTLMYLYFPSLIFSFLIVACLLESAAQKLKNGARLVWPGVCLIVLSGFLFFSPLTYGFPMKEKEFRRRMWLPGIWEPIPAAHKEKAKILWEKG